MHLQISLNFFSLKTYYFPITIHQLPFHHSLVTKINALQTTNPLHQNQQSLAHPVYDTDITTDKAS